MFRSLRCSIPFVWCPTRFDPVGDVFTVSVAAFTVCAISAILLRIVCCVSCAICLALLAMTNAFDVMTVALASVSQVGGLYVVPYLLDV